MIEWLVVLAVVALVWGVILGRVAYEVWWWTKGVHRKR